MENNFKIGDQIFVNGKWYMDVKELTDDKIKVRIKYNESSDKSIYTYKVITLPISIFTDINKTTYVINAKINPIELKKIIGSLINRICKENDYSKLFEDAGASANGANSGGMGAVSSPGLSGTPGMPGSAGSGDITSYSTSPSSMLAANEYGLEREPKKNKKLRNKVSKTKVGATIVKSPVILLTKENVDNESQSENDYKTKLYQFLDYPTDNDTDVLFIQVINKMRPTFLEISGQRIKEYFKILYNTNKNLIKTKTSEWFQNNITILGEISETPEI